MDIRLIALDLDGTLLNQEKQLSEENRAALESCIRKGIHIVPATGRSASGIPDFIRRIPGIRYGILANGARIMDFQEDVLVAEQLIGWQAACQVLTFLSRYPVCYDPYIGGKGKMEARFLNHLEQYGVPAVMREMVLATRDEVEDEIAYVKSRKAAVEKINVFTADPELRMELWEELKKNRELMITSSLEYNLEINAATATKGEGLKRLAAHLGILPRQTMAFGDGSNDISMIQAAGIGVAMANSMDSLKQQADYVTLSNEESGVAAAIRHFL